MADFLRRAYEWWTAPDQSDPSMAEFFAQQRRIDRMQLVNRKAKADREDLAKRLQDYSRDGR